MLIFGIIEYDIVYSGSPKSIGTETVDNEQLYMNVIVIDNGCGLVPVDVNTLRLKQNGRHFADDTFKLIFLDENIRISFKISLKFVPKCPINNIPTSVQIMAWRRPGDKPLSELMMVRSLTHICDTRPQWVNQVF